MPSPSPQVPAISAPQVSVHSQHPNPTSHMLSILNMNSNLNNPHNTQLSNALTSGNTGLFSLLDHSANNALANTPSSLLQQPQNPFNHLNPGKLCQFVSNLQQYPAGLRLPQRTPVPISATPPQGLPNVTRDDDDIATIIKLEDKSPPTPLVEANQKYTKYPTITNQVALWD